MEPARAHRRFAGMSSPETIVHGAILVLGLIGIVVSVAGLVLWWVSRKLKRLT
jgi:hypothetical protein